MQESWQAVIGEVQVMDRECSDFTRLSGMSTYRCLGETGSPGMGRARGFGTEAFSALGEQIGKVSD